METLTADALRIAIQDLNESIRCVRVCMKTGNKRIVEFTAEYLRLVQVVAELQDRLQSQSAIVQPLCMAFLPMPINPGFVGLSPEEKFRREWHIETAPAVAKRKAA